jgi:hypothetical protein
MHDTNSDMTKVESIASNRKLAGELQLTVDLLTKIDRQQSNGEEPDAFVRQLIRCSTSIAINYGTDFSAQSARTFISKLRKQDIDQGRANEKLNILLAEANQLISMYSASGKGVKENKAA